MRLSLSRRISSIALCLVGAVLLASHTLAARERSVTLEPWQDIAVISQNKEAARASFFAFNDPNLARKGDPNASPYFQSLNGTWRFKWSGTYASRPENFYQLAYDSEQWSDIQVPSVWERQGHGYPVYANIEYPFIAEPFVVPTDQQNHVGSYIKQFTVPAAWADKRIYIEFGAVSSAMTLWVNGKRVGYNQGSRTPAEFDISDYTKTGANTLAVEVMRWSDASWLENQDSWSLSGIFRDVSLYARNQTHIRDYFAATTLNNNYQDGVLDLSVDIRSFEDIAPKTGSVHYRISKAEKTVAEGELPFELSVNKQAVLATKVVVENVETWSAEKPNLYTLTLTLRDSAVKPVETIQRQLGFRSVELKNGHVLINGSAVKFRGVNVHEIHPKTGYVVDEGTLLKDIQLLKAGNFNAVRTSHYPQAPRFYEMADKYGLYVVDEANLETHLYRYTPELAPARKPEWAEQMLDRTVRMIERDKNHPSIVFWSPGNETGPGINMVKIYDWAKARDVSRLFQYADDTHTEGGDFAQLNKREFGKSSDILGAFYASPWKLEEYAQEHGDVSWIMMEYWHSMGNSLGNGVAYWDTINKHSILQGGFIWDWVDQGLSEVDDNGRAYYSQGGDYGPKEGVPSSGNFLHNGVIFPDRTVKPAYWEVKKAYQPVDFSPYDLAGGKITLVNRHHFTNLAEYDVHWIVSEDGKVIKEGVVSDFSAQPGDEVTIKLGNVKPARMRAGAEYFLNLELRRRPSSKIALTILPSEHSYASEQMALPFYKELKKKASSKKTLEVTNGTDALLISGADFNAAFDRNTGLLSRYRYRGVELIENPLQPNLWRALTDNDYGFAPVTWDFRWRSAGSSNRSLQSFTVSDTAQNKVAINTLFKLLDVNGEKMADYAVNYLVSGDGAIIVESSFIRAEGVRMSPRVGLRMSIPDEFNRLAWFGRGPHENYLDRHWSAYVGRYQSTTQEQYVPYLRPQENGYKTDTRWFTLSNDKGIGLAVVADETFGFSALSNPQEDFEASDETWQLANDKDRRKPTMQLHDLPDNRDGVFVHIDAIQAGVGGDNSWAKRTHNQFTPQSSEYKYRFILSGVDTAQEDPAALARALRASQ